MQIAVLYDGCAHSFIEFIHIHTEIEQAKETDTKIWFNRFDGVYSLFLQTTTANNYDLSRIDDDPFNGFCQCRGIFIICHKLSQKPIP